VLADSFYLHSKNPHIPPPLSTASNLHIRTLKICTLTTIFAARN